MSDTMTSAWAPNSLLYGTTSGQGLIQTQQNALNMQKTQMDNAAQNMEVVARAGLPLLNMSEEDAARAYGPLRKNLQDQGYGKNLPEQYPGHAVTQQFVSLGIPAEKQWERSGNQATIGSMYTPPSGDGTTGAAPAPSAGGGGTGGTGGRAPLTPFVATNLPSGVTAAEDQLVRTVIGEAGGEPLAGQQAVAHVIRNRARIGNQDTQSVIFAPNQFEPWNNAATRAKLEAIDPTSPQYQQILNTVVRPVFAGQAADPTGGATHFYSPTAQAALGRPPPSWSQGGNRTTIGRHDFFYPGYSAPQQTAQATQPPAPGTTTAPATADAAPRPVIAGDSIASPKGLGGNGVVGAGSKAVLAAVQADARAGKYSGQPVVLSTGASNDPTPDFGSIEQQIREAQGGNAGQITVLGVGPAVEAKAPGTNAKLAALAKSYGAQFVPLPAGQMSPDGVHPTAQGYAALKAAIAPAPAAPGTPAPYQVATAGNTVPPPPSGAPGGTMPPAAAPSAPAQPQQPPASAPAPSAPALPPPPQFQSNGFTAAQNRALQALQKSNVTPLQFTAQMNAYTDDNRAAVTQYQTEVNRIETNRRADAAATLAKEAADRDAERLKLAQEADTRAAADAAIKARQAARPLQGNDIQAQHENVLHELTPKIQDGTATDAEKRLYAGSYYALQQSGGQATTMTDPNNPGSTIPAMITRRLPPSFPEPEGGALPLVMAAPGAAKQEQMTAEQSKAGGYADRAVQALPVITDTSPAAMSRWQQILGQAPLGNSMVSPEFQMHLQAERNFINAVLRRESGAAIAPSEFEEARKQYIPQPGDQPPALALKKQNREAALAAMVRDAGPNYKPAVTAPAATTQGSTAPPSRVVHLDSNGKIIK